MSSNRYVFGGRIRSDDQIRRAVAQARGQASAAGRTRPALDEQIEAGKMRRRSKRNAARDDADARAAEANAKAVAAGIRRSLAAQRRAEIGEGASVRISRIGTERPMPGYDRHTPVPLPAGSDFAGWSKPSVDIDGKANLVLKLWAHGSNASGNAFASKCRYVIDPDALAGEPEEVIFSNMVGPDGPQPDSPDFAGAVVACARAMEEFETTVGRTVAGEPRVQVFKHVAIALPAGLSRAGRAAVALELLSRLEKAKLPYVAAIQRPSGERGAKDDRNFHLQLVVSCRPLLHASASSWEFGLLKDLQTLGPDGLRQWRHEIVDAFNEALAKEGLDPCFTASTRAERGLPSRQQAAAPADEAERGKAAAAALELIPRIAASLRGLEIAIVQVRRLAMTGVADRLQASAARMTGSILAGQPVNAWRSAQVRDLHAADRLRVASGNAGRACLARLKGLGAMRSSMQGLHADDRLSTATARFVEAQEKALTQSTAARVQLLRAADHQRALKGLDALGTLRLTVQMDTRRLYRRLTTLADLRTALVDQRIEPRLGRQLERLNMAQQDANVRRLDIGIRLRHLFARSQQLLELEAQDRLVSTARRHIGDGRIRLADALSRQRALELAAAKATITRTAKTITIEVRRALVKYRRAQRALVDADAIGLRLRMQQTALVEAEAAKARLMAARNHQDALDRTMAGGRFDRALWDLREGAIQRLVHSDGLASDLSRLGAAERLAKANVDYHHQQDAAGRQMEAARVGLRDASDRLAALLDLRTMQRLAAHAARLQTAGELRATELRDRMAAVQMAESRLAAVAERPMDDVPAASPADRHQPAPTPRSPSILARFRTFFAGPKPAEAQDNGKTDAQAEDAAGGVRSDHQQRQRIQKEKEAAEQRLAEAERRKAEETAARNAYWREEFLRILDRNYLLHMHEARDLDNRLIYDDPGDRKFIEQTLSRDDLSREDRDAFLLAFTLAKQDYYRRAAKPQRDHADAESGVSIDRPRTELRTTSDHMTPDRAANGQAPSPALPTEPSPEPEATKDLPASVQKVRPEKDRGR